MTTRSMARLSGLLLAPGLLVSMLSGFPACAGPVDWKALRSRPGNDDLFVMVDTSLSMAPSMGGLLGPVKDFLSSTLVQYVKKGDRVILLSFDSEARVEGVLSIENEDRDTLLLRRLIEGLDCRRGVTVKWAGTRLVEVPSATPGAVRGGGFCTDYCQMWSVATDVVKAFGDSRHRQLFLLFTDGLPDAPSYRACRDPGILETFGKGLLEDRYRLGMVALPSAEGSARALAAALRGMVSRLPGASDVASREVVRIFEVSSGQDGLSGVERELAELVSARVDLVRPERVEIGPSYRPKVELEVGIRNRSRVPRTVGIRSASVALEGEDSVPLVISRSEVSLGPGEEARLSLRALGVRLRPGLHTGTLRFEFATASRFDPDTVPFSIHVSTWWEAFGRFVLWGLGVLGLLALVGSAVGVCMATARFAPVRVMASFSIPGIGRVGGEFEDVAIGDEIASDVGRQPVADHRVFAIPYQTASALILRRIGAEAWSISWDGANFEPYLPPTDISSPERGPESGTYRFIVLEDRTCSLRGVRAWIRYGVLRRKA